ncbi:MAG: DMT family transporter [Kiritimatiellae bacterium]|nr:DMT family transporter [Kiritimatiellia bacterium]
MSPRQKGILCILASAFGFALMAFFVRLCDDFGGRISSFQKSFFRNAIALAIAAAVFFRQRRAGDCMPVLGRGGAKAWLLLLGRSAAGLVGIFGNFYALSVIPIGEAMTLNKTAPFFTVFFSWLFIRERISAGQFFALALGFSGAVLVMKPGFAGDATFATFCALAGGLGAGLAYTCVRELGLLKVDGAFIVLFFSAFSTLGSLPFFISSPAPMTFAQLLILLGAGVGAAIGQFGVTAAYRFAAPREVAVFDYSNVVFTSLLGFAFFAQIPDLFSVAGFALIVLAGLLSRRKNFPCARPISRGL